MLLQEDIAVKGGQTTISCKKCLWPISKSQIVYVPYTISCDYDASDISIINKAIEEYNTLTCVRFVPRTVENNYIDIQCSKGYWSYIGMVGGAQELSLDKNGCLGKGLIQHELNHALGFVHEHSRSDRDDYVTIMTKYISEGDVVNFVKMDSNNLILEYDYSSIMHFPSYAYSDTPGKATIVPKPDPTVSLGQTNGLTNLDLSKIKRLYDCAICSTLLTSFNGSLTSVNYPSAYPNNTKCLWLIRTPSDQVMLTMVAFDVHPSPNCMSDYIKIYDGASKTSPVLLKNSCGSRKRPPLIASANTMLLEFVTDGSLTRKGFKATYTTVSCGEVFNAPFGKFTSPGYPKKYPSLIDCVWIIAAPSGYWISLIIQKISIELSANCKNDNLKIFDGDTSDSPLLGTYCGPLYDFSVNSTGNYMLLQFHSDYSTQGNGFQASYIFVQVDGGGLMTYPFFDNMKRNTSFYFEFDVDNNIIRHICTCHTKMTEGDKKDREIKNAPSILKASIWAHFGFYEHTGKHELDMTHAVCKACHTKIKYLGNTTNLRNHVRRFHSEMLTPAAAASATAKEITRLAEAHQPRIDAMLSTLPPNSEKGKRITKAVATFIAKDLRPYSVVENLGFRNLLKTLEPRYKIPSRNHLTENVIPALYHETKAQVIASMSQASRVALMCDSWTSVTTESYVTVTAHYVSKDWKILSHVLQTRAVYESHTGSHLAELRLVSWKNSSCPINL
ncbi:embryonic protein UVS.2-like isoform X2 [Bombina bombina]|nr:embryonic protein UVS.2-like isoform X2 [Bombina bombina]XP_053565460.1 embryonic protein UVS.2-like isoform X2 [Bombina bombina]